MIGCLLTQARACLAVFVYATHETQAIAFEWKPGLSHRPITVSPLLYCRLHLYPAVRYLKPAVNISFSKTLISWPCGVHCSACLPTLSSFLFSVSPSQFHFFLLCWASTCSRSVFHNSLLAVLPGQCLLIIFGKHFVDKKVQPVAYICATVQDSDA